MPELVTELSSSELNNFDESTKDDTEEDAAEALALPALAVGKLEERASCRATGTLSSESRVAA